MKKLYYCIFMICFLSGCCSTNVIDKETYEDLSVGIKLLDTKFLKYINNDQNLSNRTKLSIESEVDSVIKAFNSLKVKE